MAEATDGGGEGNIYIMSSPTSSTGSSVRVMKHGSHVPGSSNNELFTSPTASPTAIEESRT